MPRSTTPSPILILTGVSPFDFILEAITSHLTSLSLPFTVINLSSSSTTLSTESLAAAKRMLLSPSTRAAIIIDLHFHVYTTFHVDLGPALSSFVASGGRLAFPSTEGLLLLPFLVSVFGVEWTDGGYGNRTTAKKPESDARLKRIFGSSINEYATFYGKGVSFRSVPSHEQCLIEPVTVDDFDDQEDPDYEPRVVPDKEIEARVAAHIYGNGMIAYFGDVNAEEQIIRLVVGFCTAHDDPCADDQLNQREMREVRELVGEVRIHMEEGLMDGTWILSKKALKVYGKRNGSVGEQRKLKLFLLTCATEGLLEGGRLLEALETAKEAVILNDQSRKAKALLVQVHSRLADYHRDMAKAEEEVMTIRGHSVLGC